MAKKEAKVAVSVVNPDTNLPEWFQPGDEVPEWAQEVITNDLVYEGIPDLGMIDPTAPVPGPSQFVYSEGGAAAPDESEGTSRRRSRASADSE